MRRGGPTRLGVGLIVVIMAVVIIGALVWVGRNFFGNDGAGEEEIVVDRGQQLLDEPTDATAVRMSVRGPITAQEAHYSILMTINQQSRNLTIWRGYDGAVMRTINLDNSEASFRDLLAALNRASYMKEKENVGDETQGICAVGQLIQFEILDGEETAKKLWTTSCKGLEGNFAGLSSNVIDLFMKQIPAARGAIDKAKSDLGQETASAQLNARR